MSPASVDAFDPLDALARYIGTLGNAHDTLHAACDTASHATNDAAHDAADRAGRPVADIRALSGAARDALALNRDRECERRGDYERSESCFHDDGFRELRAASAPPVLDNRALTGLFLLRIDRRHHFSSRQPRPLPL